MMKIWTISLIFTLGCSFIASHPYAKEQINCNVYQPPKRNAVCIKKSYEKLIKNYPETKRESRNLVNEADHYFNQKNYGKAFKSYDLAQANLPNAYSYIREGDALFLDYATAKNFQDDEIKSTGSCLVPSRFVWVVDDSVRSKYETGIALAKILKAGPPVSAAMLADAEMKSQCLKALADQYRATKTGCVDLAKLRTCMGVEKH